MTTFVLLTRPRLNAERFGVALERLGFQPFIEPLLILEATETSRPNDAFQATMITSANVFEPLEKHKASLSDLLQLPCFCVGAATGEAARSFGFSDVRSGTSDSYALAQLIATNLVSKDRALLHFSGEIVDSKGYDMLTATGFRVTPWILYRARAVEHFTPSLHALFLSQAIAVHPVFSPRTARILVDLIKKNSLVGACSAITTIALSQAVADVLQELPWRRLLCADSPTEESVVNCLQTEMSMNDFVPPLPPPEKRKSRSRFVLIAVMLALVLCALSALYRRDTYRESPVITAKVTHAEPLEKRVDTIETRVKTLTEIPAVETENDATLSEDVKNLQAQVSALQSGGDQGQHAARKWAAAAIAFDRMNAAAESGHIFASQLELLRHAVGSDVVLSDAMGKLDALAHEPVPTWEKLHEDLVAQESSLDVETPMQPAASPLERIRAVFHPLISVHPLHDTHAAELEEAVDMRDETAVDTAFGQLPIAAQQKLASWKRGLDTRTHLDEILDQLALLLETVPDQGAAP